MSHYISMFSFEQLNLCDITLLKLHNATGKIYILSGYFAVAARYSGTNTMHLHHITNSNITTLTSDTTNKQSFWKSGSVFPVYFKSSKF